jgi:hypothetical protein
MDASRPLPDRFAMAARSRMPVYDTNMLTRFQIDDQSFHRTGSEIRPTSKGRVVRVGVWASVCPDCRQVFTQEHRDRGFVPTKSTLRRCRGCRQGPGRRVGCSRNGGQQLSLTVPVSPVPRWSEARGATEHTEPRTSTASAITVGCPWTEGPPEPISGATATISPRLRRSSAVFTDR